VFEYRRKPTGSREADAREIRRAIFDTYRQKIDADFVALAHHGDDQIETFFIRLIRGSGLTGLCSMQECTKDRIIRPLLHVSKQEIIEWLSQNNKPFCTDSTNTDLSFLRNRIRHTLIPALTSCDPRSTQSLLRAITHLQQEEEFIAKVADDIADNIATDFPDKDEVWYDLYRFLNLKPVMQVRVLTILMIRARVNFNPSEKLFDEIIRFLDFGHYTIEEMHKKKVHRINNWCIEKNGVEFTIRWFHEE